MMLAEVMVAVALLTIVMGVVISLLVSLRQWDRRLRDGNTRVEQGLRLADRLRTDIRQSTDVSLPTKDALVITSTGNKQTRYELAPEGCLRTVGAGDAATSSRDLFSIGRAASWSLEPGPPGRLPMFIVSLHRANAADEQPVRPAPIVVCAALGADLAPAEPAADESADPIP